MWRCQGRHAPQISPSSGDRCCAPGERGNGRTRSFCELELSENYLKRPSFYSRCQAENPHILRVLAIGDEFRERIGFCGTHEKFGKCLAQRVCNDELRWRNAGTNGSRPGSERVPNELGSNDGEILEESLGDDAGLDEGMISAHFAFDTGAVVGRFAM